MAGNIKKKNDIMIKSKMKYLINRDPPGWQNEKLILAKEIISQLKELNGKMDYLILEIKIKGLKINSEARK